MAVARPARVAATPRCTAIVVLPTPPFSLRTESTFTGDVPCVVDNVTCLRYAKVTCQVEFGGRIEELMLLRILDPLPPLDSKRCSETHPFQGLAGPGRT